MNLTQMLPPFKLTAFEYDGSTLYFKKRGILHDSISISLGRLVHHQLRRFATANERKYPTLPDLINDVVALNSQPIRQDVASHNAPDFAVSKLDVRKFPALVGEISYSQRHPRSQYADYFQSTYLVKTKGAIRTVISLDIHGSGSDAWSKTVQSIDRSAVGMWIKAPGEEQPTTVMDWKPLS